MESNIRKGDLRTNIARVKIAGTGIGLGTKQLARAIVVPEEVAVTPLEPSAFEGVHPLGDPIGLSIWGCHNDPDSVIEDVEFPDDLVHLLKCCGNRALGRSAEMGGGDL